MLTDKQVSSLLDLLDTIEVVSGKLVFLTMTYYGLVNMELTSNSPEYGKIPYNRQLTA